MQDVTQDITFQVESDGERLDKVISANAPDLSRAVIQRLVKKGQVMVNGRTSKPSYRVEVGDEVVVQVPAIKSPQVVAEQVALDIIYEDDHLLLVNKPAGMVVHPSYGHESGTLVNALLGHCPQLMDLDGPERAGIVHRLDKDTSGIIVVAKTAEVREALQRQFKRRSVKKTYLALVEGHPEPPQGVIDAPVGRDKRQRKRMAIVRSGRAALTAYRVIEQFEEHSLVELQPESGRTHQLRVHLAWLGCPVVGDRVYGYRKQRLLKHRHFLHARQLEFIHPVTDEPLSHLASLPDNLARLLDRLRR
jgi:23S rRNA pseudouridine1911/1915/1917 synthase